MPLTRSKSGPRSVVSNSSAALNAGQAKGVSKRNDSVRIDASCRAGRCPSWRSPAAPSPAKGSPRKLSVARLARALARPRPVSSAGSTSPCSRVLTGARGLMARTACSTAWRWASSTRSALVMKTRSASAICLAGSPWAASCCSACAPSTSVTRPSRRNCAASSVSLASVCTTGAGSARPVVSMIRRSKSGISPACRRAKRSRSDSCRSVRTEQQMQPLASRATFSEAMVTRS